jgi:dihydroorotase
VLAARERGVLFDVGHGMGSFSFDVARSMLGAGFPPDTISSDIHDLNIDGPVFDQATTLSKFLALGMPLSEVIRATTSAPGAAIRRPDLGTFRQGAIGDATVFTIDQGNHTYTDSTGQPLVSDKRIAVSGTIIGGRLLPAV